MNEQQVVDLMKSSKSEEEWNANRDKVKTVFGGYPDFWYRAIVLSGLAAEVTATSWAPSVRGPGTPGGER